MGTRYIVSCAGIFALCTVAAVRNARADGEGFEVIERADGITVSVRDEPGKRLPTLRATGIVHGSVLHVLAVIVDDAHAPEWAVGSDETRVLRRLSPTAQIVYARNHQTWPVRDRDLVLRRDVRVVEAHKAYRVELRCLMRGIAPVEGVLRVTDCLTTISLRAVSARQTFVDYRVYADAAGDAPLWLVRRASLDVPLETMRGLARRVAQTRTQYALEIAKLRELLDGDRSSKPERR